MMRYVGGHRLPLLLLLLAVVCRKQEVATRSLSVSRAWRLAAVWLTVPPVAYLAVALHSLAGAGSCTQELKQVVGRDCNAQVAGWFGALATYHCPG